MRDIIREKLEKAYDLFFLSSLAHHRHLPVRRHSLPETEISITTIISIAGSLPLRLTITKGGTLLGSLTRHHLMLKLRQWTSTT